VLASGNDLPLRSGWLWLAVGLFAYHGLAEELAWRGYAFRRLRQGRTFGAAIRWTIP
jgi:membrane protease YdiL (CAAX protease family)